MTDDKLNVRFGCNACGADPTILSVSDPVTDDSLVSCKHCGAEFGSWSTVKAEATAAAISRLDSMVQDVLSDL